MSSSRKRKASRKPGRSILLRKSRRRIRKSPRRIKRNVSRRRKKYRKQRGGRPIEINVLKFTGRELPGLRQPTKNEPLSVDEQTTVGDVKNKIISERGNKGKGDRAHLRTWGTSTATAPSARWLENDLLTLKDCKIQAGDSVELIQVITLNFEIKRPHVVQASEMMDLRITPSELYKSRFRYSLQPGPQMVATPVLSRWGSPMATEKFASRFSLFKKPVLTKGDAVLDNHTELENTNVNEGDTFVIREEPIQITVSTESFMFEGAPLNAARWFLEKFQVHPDEIMDNFVRKAVEQIGISDALGPRSDQVIDSLGRGVALKIIEGPRRAGYPRRPAILAAENYNGKTLEDLGIQPGDTLRFLGTDTINVRMLDGAATQLTDNGVVKVQDMCQFLKSKWTDQQGERVAADINNPILMKLPDGYNIEAFEERKSFPNPRDNKLCETKTFMENNVTHGDTVFLLDRLGVTVKNIAGKAIKLFIYPYRQGEVEILKQDIRTRWEIPPDQYRLVFDGVPLEDDDILADKGIKDGSTISIVLRLRQDVVPPLPRGTPQIPGHVLGPGNLRRFHIGDIGGADDPQ